jgi:hypothetical protein
MVLGVGVALEVGEDEAGAAGHGDAHGAALGRADEVGTERAVDGAGTLERLAELLGGAADHEANGVDAVGVGMLRPLTEHAVRLAAPAGTAEEGLEPSRTPATRAAGRWPAPRLLCGDRLRSVPSRPFVVILARSNRAQAACTRHAPVSFGSLQIWASVLIASALCTRASSVMWTSTFGRPDGFPDFPGSNGRPMVRMLFLTLLAGSSRGGAGRSVDREGGRSGHGFHRRRRVRADRDVGGYGQILKVTLPRVLLLSRMPE